jgi:hypothetical protein
MWIRHLLEYLGGERDAPPPGTFSFVTSAWFTATVWIVFLLIIYACCGQSSRFIYIDF